MPALQRTIDIVYAVPVLSNAATVTNTNSNIVASVDTDGLGGTIYFIPTTSSTPLSAGAIESTGESVAVSGAGTYNLDHTSSVAGSTTYYVNVVHKNGTEYSNVITYSMTTPAAPDTEAPVITLNGSDTVNVTVGDTFTDLGAVVSDNVDSDRTIYATSGSVDDQTIGTYILYYDAVDVAGNLAAQVTRTVNINPVIHSITRTISIRRIACRVDLFRDVERGQTTSINISLPAVTPTLGNTSVTGLTITSVVDNGDGTFTINATVPVDLAKQHGTQDFDITIGAHTITAQSEVLPQDGWFVTDVVNPSVNEGNIFNNYTGDAPETGAEIEYTVTQIEAGLAFEYAPDGNGIISWADTNNTSDVVITDDIIVQARYIAPDGTVGSTATLTYEVDRVVPVITLLGSATINHQQYQPYTDAGVTVFDNVDGSGLAATPSGTVNVNAVGQYTITYTATDSAGNVAEPVTRTINVVSAGDITPPTSTASGTIVSAMVSNIVSNMVN